MGYRHFDITHHQTPKHPHQVCGDVVTAERTAAATLLVVADGLGSGIKAHIAATMCSSRVMGLIDADYSLREAFTAVVRTMNAAREPGLPYSVFTIARFLPNGECTVLSYEMPPPLLLSRFTATPLRQHLLKEDGAVIGEANCFLDPGEGILVMSDGITQAGLGGTLAEGWGVDGVSQFVRDQLLAHTGSLDIVKSVHQRARQHWGGHRGDDCTVAVAACRKGEVVTVFTGPPADAKEDYAALRKFLAHDGAKVVCGGTTAQIVARGLGKNVTVSDTPFDSVAPPHYAVEGVDLVTEGAITLNQVYNILEADPQDYEPNSGVSDLCEFLLGADRINFLVGAAENAASRDIRFRQQGILPRSTIIPLLKRKLEERGKLVVVEALESKACAAVASQE